MFCFILIGEIIRNLLQVLQQVVHTALVTRSHFIESFQKQCPANQQELNLRLKLHLQLLLLLQSFRMRNTNLEDSALNIQQKDLMVFKKVHGKLGVELHVNRLNREVFVVGQPKRGGNHPVQIVDTKDPGFLEDLLKGCSRLLLQGFQFLQLWRSDDVMSYCKLLQKIFAHYFPSLLFPHLYFKSNRGYLPSWTASRYKFQS